ncbi:hypothetical protein [Leuconostoc pseudomesenteroides]
MEGIKINIENINELNNLIQLLNETTSKIEQWQPKISFDLSKDAN